jgi:hypothetical protein
MKTPNYGNNFRMEEEEEEEEEDVLLRRSDSH